jgi:hypothetical protein
MKTTDIQTLHDAGSITGARGGGSRRWRREYNNVFGAGKTD